MGLETATYLNGLTPSWPLSGDPKNQGDDHIRLLKATLQATFPTAAGPFYFPIAEASNVNMTLDATDQNNFIMIDATSGTINVTLPAGLTTSNKGWRCSILKSAGAATNGVMVAAATGNISSSVGSAATIRIERFFEPVDFIWTGAAWVAVKPGPPIGSSMNWDNTGVPAGYRTADGTTYSTTTFAEYALARGNGSTPDKRGRVEAGVDAGGLCLTAAAFGSVANLATVGGTESFTLLQAHMPAHFHGVGISDPGHSHNVSQPNIVIPGSGSGVGGGGAFGVNGSLSVVASLTGIRCTSGNGLDTTDTRGSSVAHNNVQPTYITQKLIRMC